MDVKKLFQRKMNRLRNEDNIYKKDVKICCPVCGKKLKESTLDGVEYVETKRGTEIFIHRDCVKNWSSC